MKKEKRNKSTFELKSVENNYNENFCRTSDLNNETKNNVKYLLDFISSKNKIKFQSYFDKRGTKTFLSEKEKAMEKIILFDEINDENINKKKTHKEKKRKKKNKRRSLSENALIQLKTHKTQKSPQKVKKSAKNLNKNTNMFININYVDDIKNNENNGLKLKKKAIKINSITSNFSNINSNEPLNLAINKNDSLIYSIVSEMSNVQN